MKKGPAKEQDWLLYDTPPNEDICSLVEPNKKVLDVGCATGRIAEKLQKEKNCSVVGIEVNKEMAALAEKRCSKVIVANIEALKTLNYPENFFDIVLFADVLEHCRNPLEILQNLKRYLSPKGYILISIPNVANWRIRLKLLQGNFEYRGGTILDTGHLKFFTLSSLKKMVEQAGFTVTEVKTRNMILKKLGKLRPTLFAWGFVIKAHRKERR
jgi:methionine biosynthesis protein MetW